MGAPYGSQSASGYNATPPPDDGSTTAANKITWATIKGKITDPVKVLADAINSALRNALNVTPSTTSTTYTTVLADHMATVEFTGSTTISLGDAATMIASTMGYKTTIYNKGTGTGTVALATNTNTLSGQVNGTVTLMPGQAMTFTVAQSGVGYDITGATGFSPFVLTGAAGTNTATAAAPSNLLALYSGLQVWWTPANAPTGATTLNITPSGGAALTAKNVFWNGAALAGREVKASVPYLLQYDGTQWNILDGNANTLTVLRSYLAGVTMSTAGASTTMTVAAGQATDSTNAMMIALASAMGKTTSAWAVGTGNGGLDTGAIANSTWYHFWLIMRPDTGVVDVLISLSAAAPTMPANYTYKRRIGSGLTNGSGQWTYFSQLGDEFLWAASVLDVNANNPGTSAVSRALTVPSGVQVLAVVNWQPSNTGAGVSFSIYVSALDQNDEAASNASAPLTNNVFAIATAASNIPTGGTQIVTRTNTSSQVRTRAGASDGSCTLRAATLGWIDHRGRDS